jgi:nitronate monooxygenase
MAAEKGLTVTEASAKFCKQVGIAHPIICGAMYPCSNPELVAAASEAGGLGIIQPLSLTYVHGYDFRKGLGYIRELSKKPVGLNLLIEASSSIYLDRMKKYMEIALDEGVRFFVTALGNPQWVVDAVHARGGLVFHDVTERKWADKAVKAGVDGLICVNNRAGGHAGTKSPEELLRDLLPLKLPLICAGGVGDAKKYQEMLALGYAGVQLGTRFIATTECKAPDDYKQAILSAKEQDIRLTERISGVPVSIIRNAQSDRFGYEAGPLMKFFLRNPKLKHWARLYYSLQSFRHFKSSIRKPNSYKDLWQAGKSVEGISEILTVRDVIQSFTSR